MKGSLPFSLGSADAVKLGKSVLLAMSGAFFSFVTVLLTDMEKSNYVWLVPLATVGLNTLRKFVQDTLES